MAITQMKSLIKNIELEDDVLQALQNVAVKEEDGIFVAYLGGQLDRGTCTRTNMALEKFGGKWNWKLKEHVFDTDPSQEIADLVESGTLTIEKDGFFETPAAIIKQMICLVGGVAGCSVLEPSAGKGAMVCVLLAEGATSVHAIEKNWQRFDYILNHFKNILVSNCDFLEMAAPSIGGTYERVIMNPPFEAGQDIEHVLHAYKMLKSGGKMAAIMSEGTFFREDKKRRNFRDWLMEVKAETYALPSGAFRESGTMVVSRIVVIEKK